MNLMNKPLFLGTYPGLTKSMMDFNNTCNNKTKFQKGIKVKL